MPKSWKTIDTIKVHLHDPKKYDDKTPYHERLTDVHGLTEFKLLWARSLGYEGSASDTPEEKELFAIENKLLGVRFEGPSVNDVKRQLQTFLKSAQSLEGKWSLWVHVQTHGGYADGNRGSGSADISTEFYAHFVTLEGKTKHISYEGDVPDPFTGEWKPPSSYRELAWLREGLPDCAQRETRWGGKKKADEMDTYLEATPEIVNTIRQMQKRLGAFGEEVRERLKPKNIKKTLTEVQAGRMNLLGAKLLP